MLASEYGHVECLKAIISEVTTGHINKKDPLGLTAASLACLNGHLECLEVLVDSKAELACEDNEGRTLLHCAAFGGHDTCATFILKEKKGWLFFLLLVAHSKGVRMLSKPDKHNRTVNQAHQLKP